MKVLYSQLKQHVRGLSASPAQVVEVLTFGGFMAEGVQEVQWCGRKDCLLDIEVRQNRPDCFSVLGVAREVAAYFDLPFLGPQVGALRETSREIAIEVEAGMHVRRVSAVEIEGVTNSASPNWLKEYLELCGIKHVSLLVDLSNYVMLLTGYPSHLLDLDKIDGNLAWALNKEFETITTLDGSSVALSGDQELIIRDRSKVLALAGIVGGRGAAIEAGTSRIIAEVAVYEPATVRKNSQKMHVVTEASRRLEKELDPNGSRAALDLLATLILEYGGGQLTTKIFDWYTCKYVPPQIPFDPHLPASFAGIDIPAATSLGILRRLGFEVAETQSGVVVTPAINRTDVALQEDLVEEVIRVYGYWRIPTDEVPTVRVVKDITPRHIRTVEKIQDLLVARGFDENLSWSLTQRGKNEEVNYLPWKVITTQNPVNDVFPCLRQSLAIGLLGQLATYLRNNLAHVSLFEIGKVYGETEQGLQEYNAVALLLHTEGDGLPGFKEDMERMLRSIGLSDIRYRASNRAPSIANPYSCWDVIPHGNRLGILYKLNPGIFTGNTYFSEFNLTELSGLSEVVRNAPAVEITQKLVTLDANVELDWGVPLDLRLDEVRSKLPLNKVWSIEIVDAFPLADKTRYTVRVTYQELGDQEAKSLHLEAFGLVR